MPSNYRNFRNSVPWLIILLEAAFIILFYFLFSGGGASSPRISYPDFQLVNHVVIFGFGFFLAFLKRYSFSSTGFNLLIIVLGVQCSVLIEALANLLLQNGKNNALESIAEATVSMAAVVISSGAVLGKTNPMQLIVMTVVEIIVFHASRWINIMFLKLSLEDIQCEWYPSPAWTAETDLYLKCNLSPEMSMMHVHLFGAYFGLAVSSRFSEPSPMSEKNASTPKSDLLSLLGTLFLWVFWPRFNCVLLQRGLVAICNTYFALAVSAVTAFALSGLMAKDGKFRMTHVHSAALAGGVTIGYAADKIEHPWIAMILGLLASVISILGSGCVQSCLKPPLKIHDASGVHFTFGLPALLGALARVVFLVIEGWTHLSSLGYTIMFAIGAVCLTISIAFITGFITGLILNLKLLKPTPVSKYFEDQFYWEFPHLAVGF